MANVFRSLCGMCCLLFFSNYKYLLNQIFENLPHSEITLTHKNSSNHFIMEYQQKWRHNRWTHPKCKYYLVCSVPTQLSFFLNNSISTSAHDELMQFSVIYTYSYLLTTSISKYLVFLNEDFFGGPSSAEGC